MLTEEGFEVKSKLLCMMFSQAFGEKTVNPSKTIFSQKLEVGTYGVQIFL